MSNPPILLLAATEIECASLIDSLEDSRRTETRAGKSRREGTLNRQSVVLLITGIGPVNTAQALTAEIEMRKPRLVVQFGVAGAYVPSGLRIGDLAAAAEEVYADLGVETPDGWRDAREIGIPLVAPDRHNRFPLDKALAQSAANLLGAKMGTFLTVSTCTGTQARADELYQRFGALCESMEGAAAAHVCALYGVPFVEIRAMSNRIEDRDTSKWKLEEAALAAQKAARKIIVKVESFLDGAGQNYSRE